jgi:hypothetical protein
VSDRLQYTIGKVSVDICRGCGRDICICPSLIDLEDAPREDLIKLVREFGEEVATQGPVYRWMLASKGLKDDGA